MSAAAGVARREELHRQGVRLKAFAVAWNAVWAVVAVGVGVVVGCVALVGFGAGSRVGIISAMALLWRLLKAGPHAGVPEEGAAEGKALHLVAATVFVLALYITYEAAGALLSGAGPEASAVAIVLSAVLLVVMPARAPFLRAHGPEDGQPRLGRRLEGDVGMLLPGADPAPGDGSAREPREIRMASGILVYRARCGGSHPKPDGATGESFEDVHNREEAAS